MQNKKVPMRMCVVTREKLPKKELLRIVRFEDTVKPDITGKLNGKGCYLKKDKEVVMKAKQTKALDRALEVTINDEVYEEILKLID